jgi:hypothetical protein
MMLLVYIVPLLVDTVPLQVVGVARAHLVLLVVLL